MVNFNIENGKLKGYTMTESESFDSFSIPEGVEEICEGALMYFPARQICLPKSLKKVNDYAFAYSFIKDVIVSTHTIVSHLAFYECGNIIIRRGLL